MSKLDELIAELCPDGWIPSSPANVTPHAPGYTSPQSHTAHGRAADA